MGMEVADVFGISPAGVLRRKSCVFCLGEDSLGKGPLLALCRPLCSTERDLEAAEAFARGVILAVVGVSRVGCVTLILLLSRGAAISSSSPDISIESLDGRRRGISRVCWITSGLLLRWWAVVSSSSDISIESLDGSRYGPSTRSLPFSLENGNLPCLNSPDETGLSLPIAFEAAEVDRLTDTAEAGALEFPAFGALVLRLRPEAESDDSSTPRGLGTAEAWSDSGAGVSITTATDGPGLFSGPLIDFGP